MERWVPLRVLGREARLALSEAIAYWLANGAGEDRRRTFERRR